MAISDLLGSAAYLADTPGALTRGAIMGKPGKRASGRQLLEAIGILGPNRKGFDPGDLAGLAAGLATDPLVLGSVFGASKLAKKLFANKSRDAAEKAAGNAVQARPRTVVPPTEAANAMPRVYGKQYYNSQNDAFEMLQRQADDQQALQEVKTGVREGGQWASKWFKDRLNPTTGVSTNPDSGIALVKPSFNQHGRKLLDKFEQGVDPVDMPDFMRQPNLAGQVRNTITEGEYFPDVQINPDMFNSRQKIRETTQFYFKNNTRISPKQLGRTLGAHESAHSLTDTRKEISGDLVDFIAKLQANMPKKAWDDLQNQGEEKAVYILSPTENVARATELRVLLSMAGKMTPSGRITEIPPNAENVLPWTQLKAAFGRSGALKFINYAPLIAAATTIAYQSKNPNPTLQTTK